MKRKDCLILLVAASLLFTFIVVGCAGIQMGEKSWSLMADKEKSVMILHAYNMQYRDYREMSALANLTEAQKAAMKTKKTLLMELYPMIGVYIEMVEAGGQVAPELEDNILRLLNTLGSRLGD